MCICIIGYIGIAEFFRVRRLLVHDTRGQRTPHKVSTERTQRHTGMGHAPTRTLPPHSDLGGVRGPGRRGVGPPMRMLPQTESARTAWHLNDGTRNRTLEHTAHAQRTHRDRAATRDPSPQ